MNYKFNVEETTESLIAWIRDWFDKNGNGCNAVLGMSGGKDSTIMAALLVKAIGAERVIGVAMPEEGQGINDADLICKHLGIHYVYAPIGGLVNVFHALKHFNFQTAMLWSNQAEQNIPPRIRMTMLRAIAQSNNGRLIGTCNLSEDLLGYFTIDGDGASDVEPMGNLTVTEIRQIGDYLGLPHEWVHKTPDDGLPHSTSDEEKFGFTYETLDKYIRGTETIDSEVQKKIEKRIGDNAFKLEPKAKFVPNIGASW